MLTFCSARAWQSLPSVPGRSSRRMVNSLLIGIIGTSLRKPRGRAGKFLRGENPTPVTYLYQGRNEIACCDAPSDRQLHALNNALACATSAVIPAYLENTARIPTDAARGSTSRLS